METLANIYSPNTSLDARLGVQSYAEEIWFLLHHSEDTARRTLTVTSYMDDSGTDDNSNIAFIGGTLMNRSGFLSFEGYWNRILHDYRLDSIHMTDFVRPYGRHIGMGQEMKLSLFSDVTKQINDHKIYSVAIGVAQADYRSLLSQHVHRRLIGPYGLAFLSAGVLNGCAAEWSEYRGTIAYLVDRGHFEDQILGAHGLLVDIEKKLDKKDEPAVHTGAIAFDTDDNNVAIQAADVIAWASRRNEEPGGLSGEFDPLRGIFEDQYTPDGRPTRWWGANGWSASLPM